MVTLAYGVFSEKAAKVASVTFMYGTLVSKNIDDCFDSNVKLTVILTLEPTKVDQLNVHGNVLFCPGASVWFIPMDVLFRLTPVMLMLLREYCQLVTLTVKTPVSSKSKPAASTFAAAFGGVLSVEEIDTKPCLVLAFIVMSMSRFALCDQGPEHLRAAV